MHFWIDKRSQSCGYNGRQRIPASLSSGTVASFIFGGVFFFDLFLLVKDVGGVWASQWSHPFIVFSLLKGETCRRIVEYRLRRQYEHPASLVSHLLSGKLNRFGASKQGRIQEWMFVFLVLYWNFEFFVQFPDNFCEFFVVILTHSVFFLFLFFPCSFWHPDFFIYFNFPHFFFF